MDTTAWIIPLIRYDFPYKVDFPEISVISKDQMRKIQDFKVLFDSNSSTIDFAGSPAKYYAIMMKNTVRTEGEKYVRERVDRLVHAIRLTSPLSKASVGLEPQHYVCHNHYDDNNLGSGTSVIMASDNSSTRFSKLSASDKNNWILLSKFLFSQNASDLEKTILTGLYWYGAMDLLTDNNSDIFLHYIIGIESIVLYGNTKYKKAETFSKNCSKIFKDTKMNWLECYKMRNSTVHDSLACVPARDLPLLRDCLRCLLLELVQKTNTTTSTREALAGYGISAASP